MDLHEMKFGTIIEQKVLYQMTPRSSQSDTAFKVKYKVIFEILRRVYASRWDLQRVGGFVLLLGYYRKT